MISMRYAYQFLEMLISFWNQKGSFIDIESVNFRMAEESFMDRLGTYMHESCPKIDKDCWQANCNEPFPDSLYVFFLSIFFLFISCIFYRTSYLGFCIYRVFVVHGSDESTPVEDAFEFGKIIPDH
ncbi:uncharacterized protein LOC133723445 isoform X3 [Rosa rugosa]|uniref:uncharacterized protein LOC133723445 isoform X3 n=1 Tax=Rosa rugosa TaxID=74645 RepID=UPI002B402084|nr:uncharacterized protein LOC133723445 isoform X3 [Rosa rugosa]